jgi:hypothetical protein
VGFQDIQLGWPVFDDCFIVKASDEGTPPGPG